MTAALLVTFLVAHGALHLAVWVPKPQPEQPPPFVPQHSGVLAAARVAERTAKVLAVALAAAAASAFVLAGVGVALSASWAAPVAVAAATVGLLLKTLYFHPWLSIGVLLDLTVLAAATTGWPITLT
jgi:hypothetical protein